MAEQNQTIKLISEISKYEPDLTTGIDPQKIEIDRAIHLATVKLKHCDVLDLISSIWRGRVISSTKVLCEARNALAIYERWLRDCKLSAKKAEELIDIADRADELIEEEILTTAGLANISLAAWKVASVDTRTLEVVSKLAEGGSTVKKDTAVRLLNEQTIASSTIIDAEVKEAVSAGTLKPQKTAKLIKNLERLPEETASVIATELNKFPEDAALESCLAASNALVLFREHAPFTANIRDLLDVEELRVEAESCETLPLVAKSIKTLRDIEKSIAQLFVKHGQFQESLDRLFIETGAGNKNLRSLCDKFSSSKEILVPLDRLGRKVRVTIEEIMPPEAQTPNAK